MVLSTQLHKQFVYFPLNWPDALLSWKHNLNEIHRFLLKIFFFCLCFLANLIPGLLTIYPEWFDGFQLFCHLLSILYWASTQLRKWCKCRQTNTERTVFGKQDTHHSHWPFPRKEVVRRAWEADAQTAAPFEMPPPKISGMRVSPSSTKYPLH